LDQTTPFLVLTPSYFYVAFALIIALSQLFVFAPVLVAYGMTSFQQAGFWQVAAAKKWSVATKVLKYARTIERRNDIFHFAEELLVLEESSS
jgi:hypothetical protein